MTLTHKELIDLGLSTDLANQIITCIQQSSSQEAWKEISKKILTPQIPFNIHLALFSYLYPEWPQQPNKGIAWFPDEKSQTKMHLAKLMKEQQCETVAEFHQWSTQQFQNFWQTMLKKLNIVFQENPAQICDLSAGVEHPNWLPGAKYNISDSCFNAPADKIAIVCKRSGHDIEKISYGELNQLANRIANSLIHRGFKPQDAIAINMPMTIHAVAIYLGIIKMGGVVVSIADSFSPEEIATRLRIAKAKAIFTQDIIARNNKKLPLYEKVIAAKAPPAIVMSCNKELTATLREQDISWNTFLVAEKHFSSYLCEAMSPCNILFSSGTTGDPKAIPWNHSTPIKVASDAYLHHNIKPDDVFAWPTNLGWMMGPWLLFAVLINQGTIALYDGLPRDREFGEFIQDAKVTMLGVVPTLVAAWRQSNCMQDLNWQRIKLFSSTGECSNPEDMLYLMSLAGYKPVIEYCGGTEIGGAYVSSTLLQNNCPAVFTTPTMGLNFILVDDEGKPCHNGEVAIIPPSIGLSTELLNADHYKTYFANMPTTPDGKILRRHGDQARQFDDGTYCMLGRVDDTMNLGGIKISSAEIERVLVGIDQIAETAAIAITPANFGPSQLVIFAAAKNILDKENVKKLMQAHINQHLNPLFKIHDVVLTSELPKTASNKIMRRVLRDQYQQS